MLINDVSNYAYIVADDYLIRTPKKEKIKDTPRKVEPIKKVNPQKHLGNKMDLYA